MILCAVCQRIDAGVLPGRRPRGSVPADDRMKRTEPTRLIGRLETPEVRGRSAMRPASELCAWRRILRRHSLTLPGMKLPDGDKLGRSAPRRSKADLLRCCSIETDLTPSFAGQSQQYRWSRSQAARIGYRLPASPSATFTFNHRRSTAHHGASGWVAAKLDCTSLQTRSMGACAHLARTLRTPHHVPACFASAHSENLRSGLKSMPVM